MCYKHVSNEKDEGRKMDTEQSRKPSGLSRLNQRWLQEDWKQESFFLAVWCLGSSFNGPFERHRNLNLFSSFSSSCRVIFDKNQFDPHVESILPTVNPLVRSLCASVAPRWTISATPGCAHLEMITLLLHMSCQFPATL